MGTATASSCSQHGPQSPAKCLHSLLVESPKETDLYSVHSSDGPANGMITNPHASVALLALVVMFHGT